MRRGPVIAGLAGLGVAVVAAGFVTAERVQQNQQTAARARAITQGEPERGRQAIARYGCGGCHEIPGVRAARGQVGPPLKGVGGRVFIAGERENTPDNLMQWIVDPHSIDADTAMPRVGVSPADARDIAAYLYTLD